MITKVELRQLNGETTTVETNQVLLGGIPAVQVTTYLHGGATSTIGYYYLAPEKFDDAEHEREFNARLEHARLVIQKARSAA